MYAIPLSRFIITRQVNVVVDHKMQMICVVKIIDGQVNVAELI